MSLAYYTMDDLRLGRGGFLRKGWTIRQFPELGEALAHYRGIPITKRKVLGVTDGFHVLELVKSVPLLPRDEDGEDVLASELGEPLPSWADTPEARQAVRACVEALGLRYQMERAGWHTRRSRNLPLSCPWCSRCGRTASRTKATTAPWSWSPGSSASWPGAPWSGWSRIKI